MMKFSVPEHTKPFPTYPLSQMQENEPSVLLHVASVEQRSLVTHSSMSKNISIHLIMHILIPIYLRWLHAVCKDVENG